MTESALIVTVAVAVAAAIAATRIVLTRRTRPASSAASGPSSAPLDLGSVLDRIKEAPPLQRDATKSSLLGRRVHARGRLTSVSRHKEAVTCFLVFRSSRLLICTARPGAENPLLNTREGTDVVVTGTLRVLDATGAEIEDCVFAECEPLN